MKNSRNLLEEGDSEVEFIKSQKFRRLLLSHVTSTQISQNRTEKMKFRSNSRYKRRSKFEMSRKINY